MPEWQKDFCEAYEAVCGSKVYFIKDLPDGQYYVSFDGGSIGNLTTSREYLEKLTAMFLERIKDVT